MKQNRTIIVLIFLSLFVTGIAYSQSQLPITPPTKSISKNVNYKTDNQQQYSDNSVFIQVKPTPQTGNQKTTSNGNQQDNNSKTDFWIMWATIAIACFAFFQVLAMVFQYCAMQKQVKELRDSVNATERIVTATQKSASYMETAARAAMMSTAALSIIERAYIYVFISTDVENWKRAKEHELSPLKIEVRNYGKTPARLTSIFIKRQIYTIKGTKHEPLESDLDIIIDAPNRFVASGVPEEFFQDVRLNALVNGWDNFGEGNYYIEYSGDVRYKDIFNDDHIASFSWILYSRDYQRGFYISEADKNYTT